MSESNFQETCRSLTCFTEQGHCQDPFLEFSIVSKTYFLGSPSSHCFALESHVFKSEILSEQSFDSLLCLHISCKF